MILKQVELLKTINSLNEFRALATDGTRFHQGLKGLGEGLDV